MDIGFGMLFDMLYFSLLGITKALHLTHFIMLILGFCFTDLVCFCGKKRKDGDSFLIP